MSSLFPAQIDTNITLPTVTDNLTNLTAVSINQLRDAIIYIEQDIGLGAAGTFTTIAARLNAIQGEVSGLTNIIFFGDLTGSATSQTVVGIQNIPVLAIAPTTGQALVYNGSAYVPGNIVATEPNTLTSTYPVAEFNQNIGSLDGIIFTAFYTSTPLTATLQDNQGGPIINVFTSDGGFEFDPPNIIIYPKEYEYTIPFSVNFTLTTSNGLQESTAIATITWTQRVYYGCAVPGGNSAAFISSLPNNPLVAATGYSFTVNATADQSIYFACRSAYGAADFFSNGAEGGFSTVGTISFTNDYSFTENYTLYQSDQVGLGITSIQVFFPNTTNLVDLDDVFNPGSGQSTSGQNIVVSSLKTANYQVVVGDYLIAVGTLSSPITITLPASAIIGNAYVVKDIFGSATNYTITISGNGANVDGLTTFPLNVGYESATFVYTATNQWSII